MKIAFHLGLHKTATTWLQSVYFQQHNDIKLLNDYAEPWNDDVIRYLVTNEPKYFCQETYRNIVKERVNSKGLQNHAGIFMISAERLSGHPMSGTFDRLNIAKNIQSSFPDAKKFIFIRNQIDMIESTYQQLVKEGYQGRLIDLLENKCWKKPCFNRRIFDYETLVNDYIEIFGNQYFTYYMFEELFYEKDKLILDLCNFLDIPFFKEKNELIVNVAMSNRKLKANRILNYFRKNEYNQFPLFNIGEKHIFKIMLNLLSIFYTNNKLSFSKEMKGKTMAIYLEGNKRLLSKRNYSTFFDKYIEDMK